MEKRKEVCFIIVYLLAHVALVLFFIFSHKVEVAEQKELTSKYNEAKRSGFNDGVSQYKEQYDSSYQDSYDYAQEELTIQMHNSFEYKQGYRAGYYRR